MIENQHIVIFVEGLIYSKQVVIFRQKQYIKEKKTAVLRN